jgi:hypothetical protein
MRPLAVAEREVDAFDEMETMCGRPVSGFMCVKRCVAGSPGLLGPCEGEGDDEEIARSCRRLFPAAEAIRAGQA